MVQVPAHEHRAAVAAAAERIQKIQEAENGDKQTPLQKKYFSADMMCRYEDLAESMAKVEDQGEDPELLKELEQQWERFNDFSWASQWDGKKFDFVIYGASGYQGYLLMQYLRKKVLPAFPEITFALAGRSATKVAEMRDREFKNTPWEDVPVLVASYDDVVSVIDLVKSAHVVINVAGPYMLAEGEVLVDACIWCKAHYVDVSMEVPWSLRVKELHRYAMEAQVMVVPSCCSSAYPDLGVYMLAKQIKENVGQATRSALCYCRGGGQPGESGGFLKTRAALSSASYGTGEVANAMMDPFSLGGFIPQVDRNGVKQVDIQMGTGLVTPKPRAEDQDSHMARISKDEKLGVWRAPYANAFFDSRLVRRSNMLQADLVNEPYGLTLNFMEFAMLPPDKEKQVFEQDGKALVPFGQHGMTLDEEMQMMKLKNKEYRTGEGPPVEDLEDGWAGFFLYAESMDGHEERCSFITDDGYFESARVAVETALTLRFDRDRLQHRGGVLTPSVAGGTCLLERLIRSGVKFKLGGWHEESECLPPNQQ